jgi:hypothetical protein
MNLDVDNILAGLKRMDDYDLFILWTAVRAERIRRWEVEHPESARLTHTKPCDGPTN